MQSIFASIKKVWGDPVGSKVISAIIIAIPAWLLYLLSVEWAVLFLAFILWVFFLWGHKSKKVSSVIDVSDFSNKQLIPRFSRFWRRFFLIGAVALPITAIILIALQYRDRPPPNKFIILFADFDGDERKYVVTQTVINRAKRATREFPDIEIKSLNKPIKEQERDEVVRNIQKENQVSLIVWGFYDEELNGTVHVELVRKRGPQVLSEAEIDFRASSLTEKGIIIKDKLSGDMNLLILLFAGFYHYDTKRYDEAILRFSKALEQSTTVHLMDCLCQLYFYRGNSYFFKGDNGNAIADFSRAINIKPTAADYGNRGAAYVQMGDYKQALQDLNHSIALKPDDALVYFNRGIVYHKTADFHSAIVDFDHVINLQPDHTMAYHERGHAKANIDNYDGAIMDFNRVVALKPEFPNVYVDRGTVYIKRTEYDRAMNDFSKAISIKSDFAEAYYYRGVAKEYKGDKAGAIEDYGRAYKYAINFDTRSKVFEALQSLGVNPK